MVAAELGVDTLEGGVTVGLRLLDTVGRREQSAVYSDGYKAGRCRERLNVACLFASRASPINVIRRGSLRPSNTATSIGSIPVRNTSDQINREIHTRYGEPSGCCGAETRSSTL